jgi:hypothetical protein
VENREKVRFSGTFRPNFDSMKHASEQRKMSESQVGQKEQTGLLDRRLRIARQALERIESGAADPEQIASQALYEMLPADTATVIDGLLEWSKDA